MKMKRECKIIQDLLPNYFEHVTNAETNEFIEEHIKTCKECEKAYNSMKENLKTEQVNVNTEEVKYMKKFKNKLKALKIIILLILLAIVFIIGRRTIIMTVLNNKGEKIKETLNNYYAKQVMYNEGHVTEIETYYKDGVYLTTIKSGSMDELITIGIIYEKDGEKIGLANYTDRKVILKNVVVARGGPAMYTSTLYSNFMSALSTKLETATVNGKECYVIKYRWGDRFLDKETGFMVKEISYEDNRIVDYYLEANVVKDDDVQKPDMTGYVEEQ